MSIFTMGGYGIYVWSAFIFTFLVCLGLFLRTRKTMKKLESEFVAEAENLSDAKLKVLKNRKIEKQILTSQSKVS
tara:strand:- start:593 stop:817 length:225 start_codon:yes stop_codon:yes gene_type:complete